MAINEISHNPLSGPWCHFRLDPKTMRLSRSEITTRQRRLASRRLAFEQCGDKATIEIDGVKLCRRHAGETLLRREIA